MKKIIILFFILSFPLYAENLKKTAIAQARMTTTKGSIYSPETGKTAIIKNFIVCNTSASATTFDIYFDNDGNKTEVGNAICFQVPIASHETLILPVLIYMTSSDGNLGAECAASNSVTITVNGEESYYG